MLSQPAAKSRPAPEQSPHDSLAQIPGLGISVRMGLFAIEGLEGQSKASLPPVAPEWPEFAAVSAQSEDQDWQAS